jgi:uncharacterized delta-60 repeat protein
MNSISKTKRRNAVRQAVESLESRVLLAYSLDPTFDGDGRVIGPAGAGVELELQNDGKMVVGVDNLWPAADYLLRYNPDGSLDTSFGGGDGRVDLPDQRSLAAIALSGDKIVAAINTNADAEQFVYRFNSDGSYDTSFGGGDGIAGLGLFTLMAVNNVAVQGDGKIVVSGSHYSWFQSSHDPTARFPEWDSLAVARLNADGSWDTSFGLSGMNWAESDAHDNFPAALGIQPGTGNIVVGGTDSTSHIVVSFSPTTANSGFYTRIPFNDLSGEISALDFQPNGSIIVGNSGFNNNGALFRLTPTGQRDLSFANNNHWLDRDFDDVHVLPDGRFLVSGSILEGGVTKAMVARFTPSGTIDNSFAPGGYQTATWDASNAASDVDFTPAGKVVTAGTGSSGGQQTVGLARFADAAFVQSPSRGRPFNVNELIQAEDFDLGGEGVAYHDNDTNNRGGAYRPSEGVDIEATTDTGGGYNVGWTLPGEWMEYTINIPTTGQYNIETRFAALKGGQIHFTLDGEPWEFMDLPATGGFQNWTTISRSLRTLQAGNHVLGVNIDSVGGADSAINFNWFRIIPGVSGGTGTGLMGQYFNEMDFSGEYILRQDATVDFNWGAGSPVEGIGPDTFSVRWFGSIEAPTTGRYTFYTTTDDGVRLKIGGNTIIDHLTPQAATEWSGSIDLVGGQKYNIEMSYFERFNGALARLQWSGPGISKQVVPTSRLYTNTQGNPDTQPPTAVGNFRTTNIGSTSANVAWEAATDNAAVANYEVWADNNPPVFLGQDARSYQFNNLEPGTDYVLHVRALDFAGNRGPTSSLFITTTGGTVSSGLRGEYFNNSDFTAPVMTRTDSNINFNWGTGSPASGIDPDTFSVRWTGQITAPTTGRYTFYTTTDDGVRLWINNQLLIDKFVPQAATEWSGSIDLVAGQKYDIRMDYFDRSGGAQAKLSWSGPGIAKNIVPPSAFGSSGDSQSPSRVSNFMSTFAGPDSIAVRWDPATDNVGVAGYEMRVDDRSPVILDSSARTYVLNNLQPNTTYSFNITAFDAAGNRGGTNTIFVTTAQGGGSRGNGLSGQYFNNMDFTAPVFTRTDANVNFNWGTGSPDSRIAPDSFSVRWSGQIQAPTTGRYTFYTTSDDGMRLTINGQRLIDKLVPQATTEWSGSIDLVAGQKYNITLEYFERAGGALAKLQWAGPGISKQVVAQSQLFS